MSSTHQPSHQQALLLLSTLGAIVVGGFLLYSRLNSRAGPTTDVVFPAKWPGFGTPPPAAGGNASDVVKLHVIKLDQTTFVLRQDKNTTFEAPFMYLLIGKQYALLIDTGALQDDGGELVKALKSLVPENVKLIAVHTHLHSDHVAGDAMITAGIPSAEVTKGPFPDGYVFDLGAGARKVEVISAGSGHSAWDICFLDSQTNLLFVGDVVYPGYLYVRDYDSFQKGITNLYQRSKGRFAYTMGAHVEMSNCCGLYPSGILYQPDEVNVQQTPDVLEKLYLTLNQPFKPMTPEYAITPHSNMKLT